jgi:adenylyltransferase/sulfurtransferase
MREVGARDLAARLAAGERVWIVDVREPWEHAIVALPGSRLIPLGELEERLDEARPPDGVGVVTVCHHGVRSLSAAAMLAAAGVADVASLRGGIDAWARDVEPALPRY